MGMGNTPGTTGRFEKIVEADDAEVDRMIRRTFDRIQPLLCGRDIIAGLQLRMIVMREPTVAEPELYHNITQIIREQNLAVGLVYHSSTGWELCIKPNPGSGGAAGDPSRDMTTPADA